jgi:hypothetical protein
MANRNIIASDQISRTAGDLSGGGAVVLLICGCEHGSHRTGRERHRVVAANQFVVAGQASAAEAGAQLIQQLQ